MPEKWRLLLQVFGQIAAMYLSEENNLCWIPLPGKALNMRSQISTVE